MLQTGADDIQELRTVPRPGCPGSGSTPLRPTPPPEHIVRSIDELGPGDVLECKGCTGALGADPRNAYRSVVVKIVPAPFGPEAKACLAQQQQRLMNFDDFMALKEIAENEQANSEANLEGPKVCYDCYCSATISAKACASTLESSIQLTVQKPRFLQRLIAL